MTLGHSIACVKIRFVVMEQKQRAAAALRGYVRLIAVVLDM